jgi:hypothetical protein
MSDNQPQLSLTEAIQTRRAVRAFRPDPIPDDILKAIFELGLQSPSGYIVIPSKNHTINEGQIQNMPLTLLYGNQLE